MDLGEGEASARGAGAAGCREGLQGNTLASGNLGTVAFILDSPAVEELLMTVRSSGGSAFRCPSYAPSSGFR